MESKTYICTKDKRESIPQAKEGVKGQLGNWMGESTIKKELDKRFPGCMKGTCDDIFHCQISGLMWAKESSRFEKPKILSCHQSLVKFCAVIG